MTVDRIVLGLAPSDRLGARDARTREFARALEARLGMPVLVRNVETYDELEIAMTGGHVDVAWLPPIVFARLEQRSVATVLATVERPGDAYWSVLVTSRISGITRLGLEQLQGKRIAWVDRLSASGHIVARLSLVSQGIDPRKTFASETFEGSHQEALFAALEGRADVAATFARCDPRGGVVHGPWVEAGVARNEVVLLALLGEVPPDLIAVSRRLPDEPRDAFRAALVEVSCDPELAPALKAVFGGTSFLPGAPSSYGALRSLLERSAGTIEAFASTRPPPTMKF